MTYYGGTINQSNYYDSDELMDSSRNDLIRNDGISPSELKGGYQDNEINKDIQIVDPTSGQTVDNLPSTVKIPIQSGDETDLLNKKLLTDKQKFLGMKKNQFLSMIVVLIVILVAAIVGLGVSVYLFISDPDSSYDWKLFGIVICSVAIVVVLALFVFVLIYSKSTHKKYKQALYKELNDTDGQGNPLKSAKLERMFKHSKPIKPSQPPQKIKQNQNSQLINQPNIMKQMMPQANFQARPIVVTQPNVQSQAKKVTLVQKVVKQFSPKPVIPSPLMIPGDQPFRTSPSNIKLVPLNSFGTNSNAIMRN